MKKIKGEEAFDLYFTEVYGERWHKIKQALLDDDKKIARKNLFFNQKDLETLQLTGLGEACDFLDNCFHIDDSLDLAKLETGMLPFYRMDPASVFPAKALGVRPGETVLDMCAAPGGKSLVLVEDLVAASSGELNYDGEFVANELSPKRRHRMMSVFKRYLPKEVRQMVRIRGVDGSRIGLERKEVFERILLDAPCSGERGVMQKKSELEAWKEKRTKSFGIRQYALLASAFMALKPGGRIVYSTCSISPHENDNVIAKLKKRQKGSFEVSFDQSQFGEQTEYGTQFLPDKEGWGPIYYSIINKN